MWERDRSGEKCICDEKFVTRAKCDWKFFGGKSFYVNLEEKFFVGNWKSSEGVSINFPLRFPRLIVLGKCKKLTPWKEKLKILCTFNRNSRLFTSTLARGYHNE